jgi:hypothetical protein
MSNDWQKRCRHSSFELEYPWKDAIEVAGSTDPADAKLCFRPSISVML